MPTKGRVFAGCTVALVTPFRDGALDEVALRRLVEWHIAQGTPILSPVGTTGESPTLSHDEHERVIAIVVETAAGRANAELAQIRGVLAPMRAQLDGLPLLNRSITTMHQDLRSLRAAFNDFARTNVTAGEVEALHSDVNRVQAENAELAAKIATLERMISELAELKSPPSHPGASPTRPSAGNVIE